MRSRGCIGMLFWGLLAATLAFGQSPQPDLASLPLGAATIQQVKGDVLIQSPEGTTLSAAQGTLLQPNTRIDTRKGRLLLILSDGSQVLVQPHTIVLLRSPAQSAGQYLEELLGRVLARVKKRLGVAPSFQMGTPTATIAVRGTEFEVDVNEKRETTVEVYEGVVEVTGLGNFGPPVSLQPGFTTRVILNRAPGAPSPMRDDVHPNGAAKGSEKEENGWLSFGADSRPTEHTPTKNTEMPPSQNPASTPNGDSEGPDN